MECVICLEDTTLDKMISSETPYKLAEIIRDTWPQLHIKSTTNTKVNNLKSHNPLNNNP